MQEQTNVELLEFARFTGPGTRMYPSPKPGEVKDLVLPPMKWVQVDPVYLRNGVFMRDRNNKTFVMVQGTASPEDLDLSIPEEIDRSLSADQRELVREITLPLAKEIKPEHRYALEMANLVGETGIPQANASVTVEYLRTRQRPLLMAVADVEKRYQKRKALLALITTQLARIAKMPG